MKSHFNEQLSQLEKMIIEMGTMVEKQVNDVIRSLNTSDAALADVVIAGDKAVDEMEITVDEAVFNILALHQPVAVDLRDIVGISKMNGDLERISDHAQNIAESVKTLIQNGHNPAFGVIPKMCDIAGQMLKDAIDSFIQKDSDLAISVCERDDQIDDLNKELFSGILALMMKDPTQIPTSLEIIRISRNLERIADLCTNIAEDVVFIRMAKTIKHFNKHKYQQP